jgi:hypothetical protein
MISRVEDQAVVKWQYRQCHARNDVLYIRLANSPYKQVRGLPAKAVYQFPMDINILLKLCGACSCCMRNHTEAFTKLVFRVCFRM